MTASQSSSRPHASSSRVQDEQKSKKRGGFTSQALPLGTGRVALMRASRRNDGTTKGARDNYSTLEVLEQPPAEGWMRHIVRHWGPGRYKVRALDGTEAEQHVEVPDELAARVEGKLQQQPAGPVAVPPPSDAPSSGLVLQRLADIELAVHRIGDQVDALNERLDELAEAIDDATDDDDSDDEGRASNPPGGPGDIARQVTEMRELNAQLNATFGGPEPKVDIMAIVRAGMEVLATRRTAPNPPPDDGGPVHQVDPRWIQLIQQAEAIGLTPDKAQSYIAGGLRPSSNAG